MLHGDTLESHGTSSHSVFVIHMHSRQNKKTGTCGFGVCNMQITDSCKPVHTEGLVWRSGRLGGAAGEAVL